MTIRKTPLFQTLRALIIAATVLLTIRHSNAQEVATVVVPNRYEDFEGEGSTGTFSSPVRQQVLIPASQFDSLSDGYNLITEFSWRTDEAFAGASFTTSIRGYEMRLSTTTENSLSRTYEENVGPDEALVFAGDVTLVATGASDSPQPFASVVTLDEPFHYDPSQGNLLIEELFPFGFDFPLIAADTGLAEGPAILRVATNGGDLTWPIASIGPEAIRTPIRQFTFVSSQDTCDVNADGTCDATDIDEMSQLVIDGNKTEQDRMDLVQQFMPDGFHTYLGDSDLNGQFDEQDIVASFIAGKYLTGQHAGWAEGDWDGNLVFNDQDFVAALGAGGYLQGPRAATAAVPEPSSVVLLAIGMLGCLGRRRSRIESRIG